MFKRIYDIARANFEDLLLKNKDAGSTFTDPVDPLNDTYYEPHSSSSTPPKADPLAQYYANLELSPGADRKAVKSAWRRLMKKYHPDLHSQDPAKKEVAEELTQKLTEAYQILDKELSKSG